MIKNIAIVWFTFFSAAAWGNELSLFVQIAPKNQVSDFIFRLPTHDRHLTFSTIPSAVGKESRIEVGDGELLEILELDDVFAPSLPGERWRFDKFAVRIVNSSSGQSKKKMDHHGVYTVDPWAMPMIQADLQRINVLQSAEWVSSESVVIDKNYLHEKLGEYSGARQTLIDGKKVRISERGSAQGRDLARKFLKKEYEILGYQTFTQADGAIENFIAERQGVDSSKVIIVSSHLDSVGNAGANDDGSGTIAALSIAKALASMNLRYSIRFIAFDLEELGLYGSSAYVRALRNGGPTILGVFHMDMIGVSLRRKDMLVSHCNEGSSPALAGIFADAVSQVGLDLSVRQTCLGRSDHVNFWSANIPAVLIVEGVGFDGDPCYHRSCDKLDQIDMDYLRDIATGVALSVSGMMVY